jgi:GT2 family glycosyltransferase
MIRTDQLSFFCVAMAKDSYHSLDGLDPAFGLGFYEDADFCCRAAAKGLRLFILEECFIYHRGSASFSTMPDTVKKLLAVNRALFRSRHGRKGEGAHARWKNIRVVEQYLTRVKDTRGSLHYLIENRLAQATRLRPNNPIKKIIYARRLRALAGAAAKIQ